MDDVARHHGASAPPEDGSELVLGSTSRGTSANAVILALTRAARSFLLYDPANEAIRHFLQALRDAVSSYTSVHGDLPLAVRPFELTVDSEVVYLDRDRERSLAFRLYRDGVRRLTLQSEVPWHEVLKLLEVLSIRYTGVRQTEDDMVVLLWKAGFQSIQIEAVEGFVPEEEVRDDEPSAAATVGGSHIEVPPDFDLPAPDLRAPGPVRYGLVGLDQRDSLLNEDTTQEMPALCLRLVDHLLTFSQDRVDPLSFSEAISQFREIRDFLLTEGLLSVVLGMVQRLSDAVLPEAAGRERDLLLASFADERALVRLVHGVPRDSQEAPPEMVALLDRVPGNHLQTLVGILEREHLEASRRVARSLVERYVARDGDWLAEKISTASAHLACDLLRVLANADMERAVDAVRQSAGRPEIDLQLEALRVLEQAPIGPATSRLVTGYMGAPNEDIRLRALDLIRKRGLRAAFPMVLEKVKRDALMRLGPREAEACGEALAAADPVRALEVFREWLKPRGLFAALAPAMLQWTAVSGLVYIPSDDAETLIRHASEKAGSELQRHCTASMVKRRRRIRGVDP